jgi:valyl-tRNA synthetase
VKQAQARIVELLRADGALTAEPRAIVHPVKFYERGSRPLEFVPTRQWFIRLLQHKEALLEQGRKIEWRPGFMRHENWTRAERDWCVSRQRYAGAVRSGTGRRERRPDYARPIFGAPESLPIDPPRGAAGHTEAQRDPPGGRRDPDVMDTWATSSLTPQIVSGWPLDMERHAKLFPMDMRPQAHEIIRTWASHDHQGVAAERKIPWRTP